MGQEYTLYDWLQILLLLVGMPFVAASGAALGLVGRIRQGGFLPSTIAGLAGAAIASATLYLGIWTLLLERTISPTVFLEIYESGYQQKISIACLIATSVIALMWALGWRFRNAPTAPTRISISLRAALLMQVLSLLCVGSWCGLRLLVLKSANPYVMTTRVWESRGWTFYNGSSLTLSGSGLQPAEVQAALSREYLEDISNYPKISGISIAGCDLSEIDISPLASVKNLGGISFTDCEINDLFRKDILQLKQIVGIGLSELTTVQPTLTNIAQLPKVTEFSAANLKTEREDFRNFLANAQVQRLFLSNVDIYQKGKTIDNWPAPTKYIWLTGCNFTPDDLKAIGKLKSLTHLHLGDSPVNDSVLEHFQGLNLLVNVSFKNRDITAKGYEIVTKKLQPPLLHIMGGELPHGVPKQLGEMTKLQVLNLASVILSDEDLAAIGKNSALIDLRLTSPGLSQEQLLKLATLPKLQQLHYPSFKGCRAFENKFAAERSRFSLPPTQLIPGATMDANGAVTYIAP